MDNPNGIPGSRSWNTRTPSPVSPAQPVGAERQHLVMTAGHWFDGSRKAQREGKSAEAVMFMENAYNHVENALAAAQDALHAAQAERDALKDQWNDAEKEASANKQRALIAEDTLAFARQRIAQLEKDERRLDWLEANRTTIFCIAWNDADKWHISTNPTDRWSGADIVGEGNNLRAAIDAATADGTPSTPA